MAANLEVLTGTCYNPGISIGSVINVKVSKLQELSFVKEDYGENQKFFNAVTPFPMGPTLKENFPEIDSQVRFVKSGVQVKVGDDQFSETLSIAGQDFFEMFDFDVTHGTGAGALGKQSNIVAQLPL